MGGGSGFLKTNTAKEEDSERGRARGRRRKARSLCAERYIHACTHWDALLNYRRQTPRRRRRRRRRRRKEEHTAHGVEIYSNIEHNLLTAFGWQRYNNVCVCVSLSMCVCVCLCVHARTHTHTHIHTHSASASLSRSRSLCTSRARAPRAMARLMQSYLNHFRYRHTIWQRNFTCMPYCCEHCVYHGIKRPSSQLMNLPLVSMEIWPTSCSTLLTFVCVCVCVCVCG